MRRADGLDPASARVTEIWFYHLQSQPLERALPALVEKAVARGWRVVVQTVDDLRIKAIDDLLWTYSAESFLVHGRTSDAGAEDLPILLTCGGENPNGAALRLYVEGAEVDPDADQAGYQRIIVLFDGRNDAELDGARQQWSRLKTQAQNLAYWQQNADGGWSRRS